MKCVAFWERTGVMGPIYRLLAKGVNDEDLAVGLVYPRKRTSLHRLGTPFPEAHKSSRVGAIRFNGSVILLSARRGHKDENQPTEIFCCASCRSQSLADFGICSVLRFLAKPGRLQGRS